MISVKCAVAHFRNVSVLLLSKFVMVVSVDEHSRKAKFKLRMWPHPCLVSLLLLALIVVLPSPLLVGSRGSYEC